MLSTVEMGRLAEVIVLTKLLRLERQVAIPYGQQESWDLLVLNRESQRWERWQVKCVTKSRSNNIGLDCRRSSRATRRNGNRGYQPNTIDVIAAVDISNDKVWTVPVAAINGRRYITLTDKWKL